jgi:hypothetical protein
MGFKTNKKNFSQVRTMSVAIVAMATSVNMSETAVQNVTLVALNEFPVF